MLHQTVSVPQSAGADLRRTIATGDIITWPQAPAGLALVVEVETIRGWPLLTLALGEPDQSQPARGAVLRLIRMDEVRQSGLLTPMRFDLDRRISVAPTHPALADAPSPVVGHLCEAAVARLHAGRARIHALRDIAAERRAARRRGDRRTAWRHAPQRQATAQEGRA